MAKRAQLWGLIVAGLAATGGCASREPAAASDAARCDILVSFGSYAMGIDRPAADAVDRILASDEAVKSVTREAAGREGEYALCVGTRSAAAAARLFDRLRAALPAAPRGPIVLRSGEKMHAVPRR